jgi:excisionase family DNA binding protein
MENNYYQSNSSASLEQITFLTRSETADLLRITLPTLHNWTKDGLLPSYKIGGRVLYKRKEVFDSLELKASKGKWYK